MERNRKSLVPLWTGLVIVLLNKQCQSSFTEGPAQTLSGSRAAETCNSTLLTNTPSVVSDAMVNISSKVLYGVWNKEDLPAGTLQHLQTRLTQIIQSALNLSATLNTEADADVIMLFRSLETLSGCNSLKFVESWGQMKLLPLLQHITPDFLIRLSHVNLTCEAYQTIVRLLSINSELISEENQRLIYTHFIYTYLSRTDTTDPGCVSHVTDIMEWLEMNFGVFFTNISQFSSLRFLSPSQIAELTLHSEALHSTYLINIIFRHLEEGPALQNIKEFMMHLINNSTILNMSPEVRDIMMNRTFSIIKVKFPEFTDSDWRDWFNITLVPLLPSLTPEMLTAVIADLHCTTYQIIVEGLNKAFDQMTLSRRQEITLVLIHYLKESENLNSLGLPCGFNTNTVNAWFSVNFGKYFIYVTIEDLKGSETSSETTKGESGTSSETTKGESGTSSETTKGGSGTSSETTKGESGTSSATTKRGSGSSSETTKGGSETSSETTKRGSETSSETTKRESETSSETTMGGSGTSSETTKRGSETSSETTKRGSGSSSETTKRGSETSSETTKTESETSSETTKRGSETSSETTKRGSETSSETTKRGSETSSETTKRGSETSSETTKREYGTSSETTKDRSGTSTEI
ncbi:hypothetical protein AMEX_G11802, partial [Astyanax mexicanus]